MRTKIWFKQKPTDFIISIIELSPVSQSQIKSQI